MCTLVYICVLFKRHLLVNFRSLFDDFHSALIAYCHFKGIVSVWNPQRLREKSEHLLNISVTDGVFTTYTPLAITTTPINAHSPMFRLAHYEVRIKENSAPELYITTVAAVDEDMAYYGDVTYHFVGTEAERFFRINENNGRKTF